MIKISIYDCTLREGAQAPLVSFSLQDKLKILRALDSLGIAYTEGGWPASNPKDKAFFHELKKLELEQIRVVGFASTLTRKHRFASDDNVRAFAEAGISAAHSFGKAWDFHVTEVLNLSLEENLEAVYNSIRYYKEHIEEVSFGAEHLFDGYRANPGYVVRLLKTVEEAGADWIDLADTNGGSFPDEVAATVAALRKAVSIPLAVHCHNDTGCAVANTIAAVRNGVTIVEGTINGYSERCGMTDLCVLIPNLQLKLGYECIPPANLPRLTPVARGIAELTQCDSLLINQPYVGKFAFVHKGGMHADAFLKNPHTYQHIDPGTVGNASNILVSDQAGRHNLQATLAQMGLAAEVSEAQLGEIVQHLKEQENWGYQFELSPPSLELSIRRKLNLLQRHVEILEYAVTHHRGAHSSAEFELQVEFGFYPEGRNTPLTQLITLRSVSFLSVFRGILAQAGSYFPGLDAIKVLDYQVRSIFQDDAGDRLRVLLKVVYNYHEFNVMGLGATLIEGGMEALVEALEYILNIEIHRQNRKSINDE